MSADGNGQAAVIGKGPFWLRVAGLCGAGGVGTLLLIAAFIPIMRAGNSRDGFS